MNLFLKLSSYITFRHAGVLLYSITPKGVFYTYFRVTQTKGQASIAALVQERSIEELKEILPFLTSGVPLLLSYQGEGLVQRIYQGKSNELSKYIPNIEPKDYVVQQLDITDEMTFVALLRKEKIESVLTELSNQGISVTNVLLGFYGFVKIPDLFLQDKGKLIVGAHYLEIENQKAKTVGKSILPDSEAPKEIADKKDHEMLAMATAITFFIGQQIPEDSELPILGHNFKEMVAAKFNKLLFKYVGPSILGILLINFLVLDHLRAELQSTELNRTESKNMVAQVERLKKEISSEKEFGLKANLGKSHVFAFYADRLAAMNLKGIRFEEIAVDPVKTKIREEELIQIDRGVIVLKGIATHADDFGNLLVQLKKIPWISKIDKQVYFFDHDTGSAKFEVVMRYNEPG